MEKVSRLAVKRGSNLIYLLAYVPLWDCLTVDSTV